MENKSKSTLPKPFVFVLIPFDKKFNDIYKFGIKGAAEDVDAYAEKVDEQIFDEGILERIFNQINKADVIVADMTDRNPNVFYEVGYAHALGKVVILLTQNADHIPFDLKHRQHIVYGGEIDKLRGELRKRLIWAINESKEKEDNITERFTIWILGKQIPRFPSKQEITVLEEIVESEGFALEVFIKNESLRPSSIINYLYLFASPKSNLIPYKYHSSQTVLGAETATATVWHPSSYVLPSLENLEPLEAPVVDVSDGLTRQFRLRETIPALPPQAIEKFLINFRFKAGKTSEDSLYKIRVHSSHSYYDYSFILRLKLQKRD